MKKQTNISALKELVNNNVMERVELYTRGVQAYNIAEGEEYAVVIAYAKQGGRYYFIDREGRCFLASRYDRAEFVAGEMLEVIANDRAAAQNAADQVEASGSVLVCADLLPLFFEECDRRGFRVTSTAAGIDNLGRMLTRFDIVKDDEPAQQGDNNDESNDNDAQSAEGNQAPAEPSRLAKAAAKVAANVEAYAAKAAQRVAFLVSLLAALALALGVIFGTVWIIGTVCDALSISAAARFVVSLFALFGPALELAINIECNFLAVIARIFPGSFSYPIPFEVFSFWGRLLRA